MTDCFLNLVSVMPFAQIHVMLKYYVAFEVCELIQNQRTMS